ncbi:hypothetical protein Tco_0890483 [Tanacetum coccineum]|uniref:Copia protein n=1 Tax=Tanacetum coccineum TaxID=301880 RepID=A0ABQ5C0L0_9ASTR
MYWKIIRVGNYTELYQIFEDMLKNFDRDDLVKLWSLVHERFNSTKPTKDKERELWVELKRLFEPDDDDIIWKLQRYTHDPLKWKLYDTCVVHHVSTKRGHDIFMLVEKDYPLTRALMTLMLCNKLRVDQYSDMAPKTSHLEAVKRIIRYIKGTTYLGLWYPKGTDIEIIVYADPDHAGDYVDRKSTSGICTFVGCCLTSWFSKKQTTLAISTTEAEYASAKKACQQALWMKQALIDYDVRLDDVPIMCDNKGAIDLSKNPVQHSRTKHIKICHHFLRDSVQKGHISIEKVSSVDNIADILTKPLKRESFNHLRLGLGMMEHIP